MFNPENYKSSKAEPTDLQTYKLLYSYILPFVLEGLLYGGKPPYIFHITNHDQFAAGILNFQQTNEGVIDANL